MEIKTNMASYIEQADLCACVTGNMMYDKCRDGRPASRPAGQPASRQYTKAGYLRAGHPIM
jgi:hypothetical protein